MRSRSRQPYKTIQTYGNRIQWRLGQWAIHRLREPGRSNLRDAEQSDSGTAAKSAQWLPNGAMDSPPNPLPNGDWGSSPAGNRTGTVLFAGAVRQYASLEPTAIDRQCRCVASTSDVLSGTSFLNACHAADATHATHATHAAAQNGQYGNANEPHANANGRSRTANGESLTR